MEKNYEMKKMESFDGTSLTCYEFYNVKKPRGIMLIVHGMSEHAKRYTEFAEFLNKNDIKVFAFDLRGHGLTVMEPHKVGTYPDGKDIFEDTIKDVLFFAEKLEYEHRLPIILLGHSYGSFLMQGVIERYNNNACTILSGSAFMGGALTTFGSIVSGITKKFKGGDAKAVLIGKQSFGAYAKKFENGNWLTRDEDIFRKYQQDAFCGTLPSANFYKAMFAGLKKVSSTSEISKIDKSIPILITSGSEDPVGGKNLQLTQKLYDVYKKTGINNVELKVWENARHEVLNETNRTEVYGYILNFVKPYLKNN